MYLDTLNFLDIQIHPLFTRLLKLTGSHASSWFYIIFVQVDKCKLGDVMVLGVPGKISQVIKQVFILFDVGPIKIIFLFLSTVAFIKHDSQRPIYKHNKTHSYYKRVKPNEAQTPFLQAQLLKVRTFCM